MIQIEVNGSNIKVKDGILIKTTNEYTEVIENDKFANGLAALSELLLKAEEKVGELTRMDACGDMLWDLESNIQMAVADCQETLDLYTGGDED